MTTIDETTSMSNERSGTAAGKPRGPRFLIVQNSPRHRAVQAVLIALTVVALLWAAGQPTFRLGQFTNVFIIAIAVVGLNIVTGYTGLLSIGHSAFFGLGAYTTGILIVRYEFAPLATIPLAVLFAFVLGLLVGLPSLRIHGLYLALVTLAVAVSFPEIVRRAEELTGGAAGMVVRSRYLAPPEWTGLVRGERAIWMFWLSAAVLAIVMLLVRNLVKSRFGIAMRATRDNEIAAAANGVSIARTKILAFGISGAITGLAGSLFGMYIGALSPDGSFTLMKAIELVTGLVLGGIATQIGPLVGAFAVVFLPYWTASWAEGPLSGVVFGVLLIALVFLMPEGIVGRLGLLVRKVVAIVPSDHPRRTAASHDPPPEPPSPPGDEPLTASR
ncbi:branched-chain amino acid transport system permease protein [Mumia flava]|uniref:Branched-chain amino acid transport system permease protein n=1 Tax=Mumia flava TaxID=1348852 RepID=A0A2M9BH98_9ACTN|nr:branched-chain amino acid ABC transporter permease [Mumia flava]PJJ57323.1 branched-chain amino acid transport system permease protein [Mumia flava]